MAVSLAAPAAAWGDLGHRVTALIAYRHLTPAARRALDALLASDDDALTPHDFASRATWADKYRVAHRETAAWHFVDVQIDHPALAAACFGFPELRQGEQASAGPAQDCIIKKVDQFFVELKDPGTSAAERLLALKFLLHLVGDLHQPLHVADHQDKGGNCVGIATSATVHERNLHAYWDVGAVDALGRSAERIAGELDATITPEQMKTWTAGDSHSWALESFTIGQRDVYKLSVLPTCATAGYVELSDEYQAAAKIDTADQLRKAGVRLAGLLNGALGS